MEKSEKESIKLKLRNVHLRIAYLFMAADGKIEDTELNYFNEIGNCCSTFETQKENIIKYCEDVLDSKHTPISAIKRIIKSNPISLEGATSFLDYFSCSPSRENANLLWILINLGYIDGDYSAPEREIVELISKECKFPPDVLLEMEDIAKSLSLMEEHKTWFLPQAESYEYTKKFLFFQIKKKHKGMSTDEIEGSIKQIEKDKQIIIESLFALLNEWE